MAESTEPTETLSARLESSLTSPIQAMENEILPNKKNNQKKNQKKSSTKKLPVNNLPSAQEIYDAIPADGIDVQDLAARLSTTIDATNASLFRKILEAVGNVQVTTRVKRKAAMPSNDFISNIIDQEETPPAPMPKYNPEKCQITHQLIGEIEISFCEYPEKIRRSSTILPNYFYRVFYETSATLCHYVTRDTHSKHRDMPNLKLQEGNAFQAIGTFNLIRDLTKQRIERHLIWNQKQDPSSYISVFNNIKHAKRRAVWHHHESKRIGERTSVAEITTAGLVPATIKATVREKTVHFSKSEILESFAVSTHDCHIPAWIHKTAIPEDGSSITLEELEKSGADIWLSMTELSHSDLKVGFNTYNYVHDHEWLACGQISRSRIKRVMPFDGQDLHGCQTDEPVRSRQSGQTWTFDWESSTWRLDITSTFPRQQHSVIPGQQSPKRMRDDDDGHDDSNDQDQHKKKQHKGGSSDGLSQKVEDANTVCCPGCGLEFSVAVNQSDEVLP